MSCEFAIKRDGEIKCMCSNLGRGLIKGKSSNVRSNECIKNPDCYYKMWKREINNNKVEER